MPVWRVSNGAVSFSVKVVTRASRNEFAGLEGDAVRVRLRAPPVEGKANEALSEFLASQLGVSRRDVEILAGRASRRKIVRIRGVTPAQIEEGLRASEERG